MRVRVRGEEGGLVGLPCCAWDLAVLQSDLGMPDADGVVTRLWRYPVKSMRGEECERLDVDQRGAAGDRVYAVRDASGKFGSGKTTRRFRRIDGLLGFRAAYRDRVPSVVFPDGRVLLGDDPAIHGALSEALGQPVTLVREAGIPHLDAGPLHLLTTASLAWLRSVLPLGRIDERRFRPNMLIDVPGETQVERGWLGKTLRIGAEVTMRVRELTERCVMVDLAQGDLPVDERVLQAITSAGKRCFGAYAEVLESGTIARGDLLTVGR